MAPCNNHIRLTNAFRYIPGNAFCRALLHTFTSRPRHHASMCHNRNPTIMFAARLGRSLLGTTLPPR
eukprot:1145356-Pelagomonas_calceolata.AAC.3